MLEAADIDGRDIKAVGISNQRETAMAGIVRPDGPSIGPSSGSVPGARQFVKNFVVRGLIL